MKIVAVKPAEPVISLTWMVSSRCNYDCVYCPSELHDNTSAHPDFEKLKQSWLNFYNKTKHSDLPYKLSFTGGEVTANRNFLPLIEYIRSENFNVKHIDVTSNGSASLKYYQKLCQYIDTLSFSVHSEYINEQEFFIKSRALNEQMIRPTKSFHVIVMDELWNRSRISMYQEWLEQNQISYSINKIDHVDQTQLKPVMKGVYNLEQI